MNNFKEAGEYLNEGIEYSKKKEHKEAINCYTKAIELKPNYTDAYYYRGLAYYSKGEYDNAINDYTKAIELIPNYADAYYNRGLIYAEQSKYKNAIKDFNTTIEFKPDSGNAYYNRGSVYYDKDEYDNAINDYTKAIELNPDNKKAYYYRGIAYTATGESNKASKDFTKAMALKNNHDKIIKLKTISITNYKGIDSFTLNFPSPKIAGEPEILAMGSKNGLGKTSIIECCTLLLMCLQSKEKTIRLKTPYTQVDIPDLLIRAGAKFAEIIGNITIGDKTIKITLHITRKGFIEVKKDQDIKFDKSFNHVDDDIVELLTTICGFSLNPVISNKFLFFHSYRKVQEGNLELGMMVSDSNDFHKMSPSGMKKSSLSKFKIILLQSMMNKADLFENESEKQFEDTTIDTLNSLVKTYANGTMGKLKAFAESTVDFRVDPIDGGEASTFDGLSSGQKEIISTLFLIWYHTKNNPSVVLIDEPELHLNARWHESFISKLIKLAPDNQYILATHSVDIMDSIDEDQRIFLLSQDNADDN